MKVLFNSAGLFLKHKQNFVETMQVTEMTHKISYPITLTIFNSQLLSKVCLCFYFIYTYKNTYKIHI